jgi:hypothetical protein
VFVGTTVPPPAIACLPLGHAAVNVLVAVELLAPVV